MGNPAARVLDVHTCPLFDGPKPHVGGPVLPPGKLTVLIEGQPAARLSDKATCASSPDVIAQGSANVFIGGLPAARLGGMTAHGGVITAGCPTVLIGGAATEFDNEIQDGTPEQRWSLARAHYRALLMTEAAIARLEAAKTEPDPLTNRYFGIRGTSPSDQEKLDKLIGNYGKIKEGIRKASYEVENEPIDPRADSFTVAYVYTLPVVHGVGDVHACFPAFDRVGDEDAAATTVHELSHYTLGTRDHAYEWETQKWRTMSQEQRMDNADNYGHYAREAG